jgi:hypothetical protein
MAIPARIRYSLALIALLAGCAGGPSAPDWQARAAASLEAFQRHYLTGDSALADAEFRNARAQLARTGRGELVARAELVRCAVRAASLEFDACPGFEVLRDEAGPEERAYAEYLAGRGRHAASDEPLSRLVAAAVRLRSGALDPAGIATAVEIASREGWRRPLLAWLAVQERRALEAGDAESAARIRRRMELVSG